MIPLYDYKVGDTVFFGEIKNCGDLNKCKLRIGETKIINIDKNDFILVQYQKVEALPNCYFPHYYGKDVPQTIQDINFPAAFQGRGNYTIIATSIEKVKEYLLDCINSETTYNSINLEKAKKATETLEKKDTKLKNLKKKILNYG